MPSHTLTRRQFVGQTAAASALFSPYVFTSSAGAVTITAATDRPGLGLIGAGRMGYNHMRFAKRMCDVVAVADVDLDHLAKAKAGLSDGKAATSQDYRDVLANKQVDVVYIATPDHWHTKILIEAMLAGKDVYCEKPLTLTIDEGKLVRKVQQQTGRVVQVGTMQRSFLDLFVKAIAMVQQGRLGKLQRVQAAIGGHNGSGPIPVAKVPAALDWDRWLGPAPQAEYRYEKRGDSYAGNTHQNFRWWYEYSGGKLTDWGAHHVDISCWALRAAGQSDVPISIDGTAKHSVDLNKGYPVQKDRYNTANSFLFTAQMQDDCQMVIRSDTDNGVLLEGDKGRIFVNRGKLVGKPVDELKDNPLPEDAVIKAYKGIKPSNNRHPQHWANFFQAVRDRSEVISDVDSHMRALNICHLAGISGRLGRGLTWNGETETITDDDQANTFLKRDYRPGYEIEM